MFDLNRDLDLYRYKAIQGLTWFGKINWLLGAYGIYPDGYREILPRFNWWNPLWVFNWVVYFFFWAFSQEDDNTYYFPFFVDGYYKNFPRELKWFKRRDYFKFLAWQREVKRRT